MNASSEVSEPSTPAPVGQQAQDQDPKEKNVSGHPLGAIWNHFSMLDLENLKLNVNIAHQNGIVVKHLF